MGEYDFITRKSTRSIRAFAVVIVSAVAFSAVDVSISAGCTVVVFSAADVIFASVIGDFSDVEGVVVRVIAGVAVVVIGSVAVVVADEGDDSFRWFCQVSSSSLICDSANTWNSSLVHVRW